MQSELRCALETLRIYHDLSVATLAERLDISEKRIVSFEKGRRKITLEVLYRYAHAFEIPVSSLLLLAEQSGGVYTRDTGSYVADKVVVIIEWLTTINTARWKNLTRSKQTTAALLWPPGLPPAAGAPPNAQNPASLLSK
jgi:DNA-binding XRE family transcriptional regulator